MPRSQKQIDRENAEKAAAQKSGRSQKQIDKENAEKYSANKYSDYSASKYSSGGVDKYNSGYGVNKYSADGKICLTISKASSSQSLNGDLYLEAQRTKACFEISSGYHSSMINEILSLKDQGYYLKVTCSNNSIGKAFCNSLFYRASDIDISYENNPSIDYGQFYKEFNDDFNGMLNHLMGGAQIGGGDYYDYPQIGY